MPEPSQSSRSRTASPASAVSRWGARTLTAKVVSKPSAVVRGVSSRTHTPALCASTSTPPRLAQLVGQAADLGQHGQVADDELRAELLGHRPAALLAAAVDDDAVPVGDERPRGSQADAVGGAGEADRRHAATLGRGRARGRT